MKYFVIEVSAVNHDTITKAITEKEDKDLALVLFHQIRASQLITKDLTYGYAEVIDETGTIIIKEWSGREPEPEPENTRRTCQENK